MTNIFFTSDTHFNHAKIIQLANRPFADLAEMQETMIQRWNERVKPGDLVYHLGDFAITYGPRRDSALVDAILSRLNGSKFLVIGNHDRKEVFQHKRWVKSVPYHEIKTDFDGKRQPIVLCHYPLRSWNHLHDGGWMLHGHSHGSLIDAGGKTMDVGVDVHDYAPISLEEVGQYMARREIVSYDHHRRSVSESESADLPQ
jgi:calcineurin-like phosphoesterase family protein